MGIVYLFLFGMAVAVLFYCEESPSSCRAVGLLSGICLMGLLLPLLPEAWVEAIPRGYRLANPPRALLFVLLAYAMGYPLTTRLLYPLRDRLMEAFDRWYSSRR